MANYIIQDTTLTNIADAIRSKTGATSTLTPAQMVAAINSLSAGGILAVKQYTDTDSSNPTIIRAGEYYEFDTELPVGQWFVFVFTVKDRGNTSTNRNTYVLIYDGLSMYTLSTTGGLTKTGNIDGGGSPPDISFALEENSTAQTNMIRIYNNETSYTYNVSLYDGGYNSSNSSNVRVWGNLLYLTTQNSSAGSGSSSGDSGSSGGDKVPVL